MLECAVFHKNNLGWQRNEFCSGQIFPFHRIFTSKTKLRISITKLNITSKSVSQSGQFIEGNHCRNRTVIVTQTWLKNNCRKKKKTMWKSLSILFCLSEFIFRWPPSMDLSSPSVISIHEILQPVGKEIYETIQPSYRSYILIKKIIWKQF